jgi:hypothetical protein
MIVFLVSFVLFTIEALIHYNYGKEETEFQYPDTTTFLKIISTVFLFSILTSITVRIIKEKLNLD